jgi:uncharacterized protein (DUF486 family)
MTPDVDKTKLQTNMLQSRLLPIVLLLFSNIFMTAAWYGHLRFKSVPLWQAILVSWGIAFFEYCLMVPANRWGFGAYNVVQLKVIQEIITLIVFSVFAVCALQAQIRWNHIVAFALIVAAAGFTFLPQSDNKTGTSAKPRAEITSNNP